MNTIIQNTVIKSFLFIITWYFFSEIQMYRSSLTCVRFRCYIMMPADSFQFGLQDLKYRNQLQNQKNEIV